MVGRSVSWSIKITFLTKWTTRPTEFLTLKLDRFKAHTDHYVELATLMDWRAVEPHWTLKAGEACWWVLPRYKTHLEGKMKGDHGRWGLVPSHGEVGTTWPIPGHSVGGRVALAGASSRISPHDTALRLTCEYRLRSSVFLVHALLPHTTGLTTSALT